MFAQLVTINGKIYVGLQRKSYYEDKNNRKLKSILLPIEAWTTFVSQAVPTLDKAIKEHHATHPPSAPETTTQRKRPYSNGILTLDILTVSFSNIIFEFLITLYLFLLRYFFIVLDFESFSLFH